jgi:hypothetical protein
MIRLALVLVLQGGGWNVQPAVPTVGDTVWITRSVPVATALVAAPGALETTDVLQPLADPVARVTEGRLVLEYAVALFAPGAHDVVVPEIELLYADGRVEALPGATVGVTVASVLPDTAAAPRHSLGPYAAYPTRPIVPIVLVGVVLAVVAIWTVRRRRVGPRAAWRFGGAAELHTPVDRWVEAGEGRAVIALAADAVRSRIAARAPDIGTEVTTDECLHLVRERYPSWPLRDLTGVLRELDRARFAPAVSGDVLETVGRVEAVVEALESIPVEEPA